MVELLQEFTRLSVHMMNTKYAKWPPTFGPSQPAASKPHPPLLLMTTQPKSWYSFYCLMEVRRLSQP